MVNSGCATKAMCELREDISDVVGPVVVGEVSCCQENICSGSGIQMCVYQTERDSVGCYTNVLFTVKPQVNSVTSRQALSLHKGDNSALKQNNFVPFLIKLHSSMGCYNIKCTKLI